MKEASRLGTVCSIIGLRVTMLEAIMGLTVAGPPADEETETVLAILMKDYN